MYIPTHFEQPNLDEVHRLIQQNPLAVLVNHNGKTLNATHLPLHFSPTENAHGVLRGHVAKANPMWQELSLEKPVLVLFQGPEVYITPNWYPSKQRNGKVVPTWNYATVHMHAQVSITQDSTSLRTHLEHLVSQNEAPFEQPWSISDAPADYINNLINHIVGIELIVTDIEAKWKASQNQPAENSQGVLDGLNSSGSCPQMAKIIEETRKR